MMLIGLCLVTAITGYVAGMVKFIPDKMYANKKPKDGELWKLQTASNGQCAIKCYEDSGCTSIFYGPGKNKEHYCLGYSEGVNQNSTVTTDAYGWSFFRMDAANKKRSYKNPVCDPGWESFEDSCYLLSKESADWHEAEEKCMAMRGYLVEIASQKEQEFVGKHVRTTDVCFWAGGRYDSTNKHWYWSFSGDHLAYTNWYPGEPNFWPNGIYQEYIAFTNCWTGTTEWDNADGANKDNYVCERRINQ